LAYERLVRKLTHENLWLYILTLLSRKPLYGYEVRKMIEQEFGFKPGRVTSYAVLYRLEKDGLIKVVSERKGSRGPSRKYYMITDRGLQTLAKAKQFLRTAAERVG